MRSLFARRSRLSLATALVATFAIGLDLAHAGSIPTRLKSTVLGATKRAVTQVDLDGVAFESIDPFSSGPYLLWRADPAVPLPFARTHASVQAWLERSSAALRHDDLELRFLKTSMWQGEDVWVYQMSHRGIAILDATIDVHWAAGELEGVLNRLPGRITSIEGVPADLTQDREWVFWAERNPPAVDLKLGWIEREYTDTAEVTRIVSQRGVHLTRIAPYPVQTAKAALATFTEYPVPSGTFPDQIGVDNQGKVWFSQPFNNVITKFDPVTTVFTSVPTTGGNGPDGLWVDPINRVWTGLYNNGFMGQWSINSSTWSLIPMPYAPSNPAIPFLSRSARVWITDHQNNRISEWDPAISTWTQQVVMPSPNCWVVQGTEDVARQTLYFAEYNVSKIGKKPWIGPVTDITTPGGGIAFCVYARSRVFYSNWNNDRMGVYNVVTGQIVEYVYPVAGETGGPITKTPSGLIAVGTKNRGYIMVFDPVTSQFTAHQIPTAFPGLKDGICSDKQNVIWFTETTSANKIGKLVLP